MIDRFGLGEENNVSTRYKFPCLLLNFKIPHGSHIRDLEQLMAGKRKILRRNSTTGGSLWAGAHQVLCRAEFYFVLI